ncbi:MAG: hypothetical protein R2744_08260 [Bacteroidales bacterium]
MKYHQIPNTRATIPLDNKYNTPDYIILYIYDVIICINPSNIIHTPSSTTKVSNELIGWKNDYEGYHNIHEYSSSHHVHS